MNNDTLKNSLDVVIEQFRLYFCSEQFIITLIILAVVFIGSCLFFYLKNKIANWLSNLFNKHR